MPSEQDPCLSSAAQLDCVHPHPVQLCPYCLTSCQLHSAAPLWPHIPVRPLQVDLFDAQEAKSYKQHCCLSSAQLDCANLLPIKSCCCCFVCYGLQVDPFDAQEAKPYKQDPEIIAMTNLVDAYQNNDINEFERILRSNRWAVPVAMHASTGCWAWPTPALRHVSGHSGAFSKLLQVELASVLLLLTVLHCMATCVSTGLFSCCLSGAPSWTTPSSATTWRTCSRRSGHR